MNKDRRCDLSCSQHNPQIQDDTDARVEVLLFLGIIFWCWLLILFFQKGGSSNSQQVPALYWNGTILQTVLKEDVAGSDKDEAPVVPAAVAPFLFLPIPVNFADAELLSTISGIGPELAAQIIATRNARGQFSSPQDLLAVPGIGPSRMNQFAPQFSFTTSQ